MLTNGGWLLTTLKKLKGAALTTPLADCVVTQAIGRGMTLPESSYKLDKDCDD
jgi:uncharacterized protein YaaW (UPF0174 family)